MATSTYLNIPPLKGESTDTAHKDWIEIESFNMSVSQPISGPSGTGGRSAARADFSSLGVSKSVDTASCDLNQYCASGKHIAKLELEVCQETGGKVCYWKYTLEDVMVQSVSTGGGGSGRPMESVSFVFDKIKWEYTAVKNDGSKGAASNKEWDLKENK